MVPETLFEIDGLVEVFEMRFFVTACLFCLLIASVGCMTKNWSAPIFQRGSQTATEDGIGETEFEKKSKFWNAGFGEVSGLDERSREIERRLGY